MPTISRGAPLTLDCRRVPPGRLATAVLEAFDALQRGERVRLVCTASPREALAVLERERPHTFEWFPVVEGPAEWQVEIERREADGERPHTVRESMDWSHRRMEELEEAAFRAREARRYAEARSTFSWFAHALRRHIDVEEQLILPEFDARSGMAAEHGPSTVMRAEHRAISAILGMMVEEIGDPEAPVELTRAELARLLRDHHLKEDKVLYPALDRLVGPSEAEALVRRIQSWARG